MITVFIIFFVLFLIEILILGFVFSKISLEVLELDINNRENKTFIDNLVLEINIYMFYCIKLIKIKVYKNYIKVFGIRINTKKISNLIFYKEIKLKDSIFYYIRKINFKNINLKIKYMDLKLDLGTLNPVLTSIVITSISSIFPFLIKNYIEIDDTNFKYTILPNYFNINNYQIKLKTCLNFKLFLLIRELIKIMNNNTINEDNSNNYKYI